MAEQSKPTRAVTVACNIPGGLVLRICKPRTTQVLVVGGGVRDQTEHYEVDRVRINGNAIPVIREPGKAYPVVTPNGYALTSGVDAEKWEAWLAVNKESPAVVNGCIFAVPDDQKAAEEARRHHRDATSGMEPLRTDGDPRMPRRVQRTQKAA